MTRAASAVTMRSSTANAPLLAAARRADRSVTADEAESASDAQGRGGTSWGPPGDSVACAQPGDQAAGEGGHRDPHPGRGLLARIPPESGGAQPAHEAVPYGRRAHPCPEQSPLPAGAPGNRRPAL